jgi:hypothetical protein
MEEEEPKPEGGAPAAQAVQLPIQSYRLVRETGFFTGDEDLYIEPYWYTSTVWYLAPDMYRSQREVQPLGEEEPSFRNVVIMRGHWRAEFDVINPDDTPWLIEDMEPLAFPTPIPQFGTALYPTYHWTGGYGIVDPDELQASIQAGDITIDGQGVIAGRPVIKIIYNSNDNALWYDAETYVVLGDVSQRRDPNSPVWEAESIEYNVPVDPGLFEIPAGEGSRLRRRGRNISPAAMPSLTLTPLYVDDGALGMRLNASYTITHTRDIQRPDMFAEYFIQYLSSGHNRWARVYQYVDTLHGFGEELPREVFRTEGLLQPNLVSVNGQPRQGYYELYDDSPTQGPYAGLGWDGQPENHEWGLILSRGLSPDEMMQLAGLLHP